MSVVKADMCKTSKVKAGIEKDGLLTKEWTDKDKGFSSDSKGG